MNTSSFIRAIGSPVLIAAFIVAPITPAFFQVNFTSPLRVSTAEAAAISYGSITGVIGLSGSATSKVSEGTSVNVYLKDSNALVSTTVTDKNGAFAFMGVQGLSYKIEVTPSIGFGFVSKASSTAIVDLNINNIVLNDFNIEKLPSVKMFGPSIMTIQVGNKFEDPGVVFAKEDGTVVSGYGIDGLGKVDTTIPGKYVITYHVDDKATNGYPTIDATRTINVLPKVIEVVSNVAKKSSGLTVLPTVNTKVYLNSYLGKSFVNDKLEVLKLQAFLYFKEGNVNVKATGVYDTATEIAVRNFQDKYYKEVLMPWGTEDNTGEVRMTTLKKINDLYNGVSTPLTKEQELTLQNVRSQDEINKNAVVKVEEIPFAVQPEEKKSIGNKISSWWNSAKRSLIAAFPSFSKDDKESNESAPSSLEASIDKAEKTEKVENNTEAEDNLAAVKEVRESAVSKSLIFFATVFALLAFVVAIYIYRKTRVPELIAVEEAEVPKKK